MTYLMSYVQRNATNAAFPSKVFVIRRLLWHAQQWSSPVLIFPSDAAHACGIGMLPDIGIRNQTSCIVEQQCLLVLVDC